MTRMTWEIEVRHEGLNKYRHIRGSDRCVVEQKADAQKRTWDEMWLKKQEREKALKDKEKLLQDKEEKKSLAEKKTREVLEDIQAIKNTLQHTLNINDAVDWNKLLDKSIFLEKKPQKPILDKIPDEPGKSDKKYNPGLWFFHNYFPKWKANKIEKAKRRFDADYSNWLRRKTNTEASNKDLMEKYEKITCEWELRKNQFYERQEEKNKKILKNKQEYLNKEPGAITDYCEMVLSNSQYPDQFPQEYDLEYKEETKLLVVDYLFPNKEDLPTVKDVKYVASKNEFVETKLAEVALNELYDNLLYQITLRTTHELYESDLVQVVDSIVFNGWVNYDDKATGQQVKSCILSVQTTKEEFSAIKLEKVDPKACFRKLKGVGSSKLHGLAPIAPIIQINKEDRRFIPPYNVIDSVDVETNIAAMDWQDFENLVREIFEKEFASTGGEVKITQASRDGGVDAVAFDNDPIRGGKIIIQAKRYTNVVGVAAVRELYGTVIKEGAAKGILVTTSDYGPDSYQFAKDKPLTLLNGNNLLHLLKKHGQKAKIDIKEAKLSLRADK